MVVVLPAPLGPTKPVTSPVGTCRSRGPRVKEPWVRTTPSRLMAFRVTAGALRSSGARSSR